MIVVWLLVDLEVDHVYGVFSTPEAGIAWLRKSRPFMHDPSGPIIPHSEGLVIQLNARFALWAQLVDPPPLDKPDDGAIA